MLTVAAKALDLSRVKQSIETEGYFALERALEPTFVGAMLTESGELAAAANVNDVHAVRFGDQAYLTHCLAKSRSAYQFVTSDLVLDICKHILGDEFYLHAKRIYTTSYGHHMQWHSDNKKGAVKLHFAGLIFIVYLCDVIDGEFQYLRGSHNWSGARESNDYTDAYVEEKHRQDIISFRLPKGSLLIYDIYGVHRAKPIVTPGWTRKSLFFGISSEFRDGEKILVNTEFLDNLDDRRRRYLRLGQRASFETFPSSDVMTLTLKDAAALQAQILRLAPSLLARRLVRVVPESWRWMAGLMRGRGLPAHED
jgi:hypothetical protein